MTQEMAVPVLVYVTLLVLSTMWVYQNIGLPLARWLRRRRGREKEKTRGIACMRCHRGLPWDSAFAICQTCRDYLAVTQPPSGHGAGTGTNLDPLAAICPSCNQPMSSPTSPRATETQEAGKHGSNGS
jgi:hypothetical protein